MSPGGMWGPTTQITSGTAIAVAIAQIATMRSAVAWLGAGPEAGAAASLT